jgi:hypothetical protein
MMAPPPGVPASTAAGRSSGPAGRRSGPASGRITWLATDDAERFARVGGRFFGSALSAAAVEIVDL